MERKPIIVRRPDAPGDAPKPQLSKEEIRALLAVTESTARPTWSRVARRGGIAIIPTTLLSILLDSVLGWWSIPVIVILAIAWTARPLVRQRRDGWA